MVDGKLVRTLAKDINFCRSSDGSTLSVPIGEDEKGRAVLWDNKTGTAYRLDLMKRIAYEDPHSPHIPNAAQHQLYQNFPDGAVGGVRCKVVPLRVHATTQYSGFSPTPGNACYSPELGLELRSEVGAQTGEGKTERHLREMSSIRSSTEPDPSLFDLRAYTISGTKN
jgi:hypothetical protein